MASVPVFVAASENFNDGGAASWVNVANIIGNTGSNASSSPDVLAAPQRLRGFTAVDIVPGAATIDGVLVEWQRSCAGGDARIEDASVQLLVAGVEAGNDKSVGTGWTTAIVYFSYGGVDDTWGLSLTAAQVNSGQFGSSLKASRSSALATRADVFRCRITVFYTEGGSGQDNLSAASLLGESSTVGLSTIGQSHSLSSGGFITLDSLLGSPSLSENVDGLNSSNLVSSSASASLPEIGQIHALTTLNFVMEESSLGFPFLSEGSLISPLLRKLVADEEVRLLTGLAV